MAIPSGLVRSRTRSSLAVGDVGTIAEAMQQHRQDHRCHQPVQEPTTGSRSEAGVCQCMTCILPDVPAA